MNLSNKNKNIFLSNLYIFNCFIFLSFLNYDFSQHNLFFVDINSFFKFIEPTSRGLKL